jgi:Tfp pilus assembly protein PilO
MMMRMMTMIIIIIIIVIIINQCDAKQEGIQQTKARLGEVLKNKWKNKVMHGQYIRNIDGQLISEEDTFLWLLKGDLTAETKSEIVAAQDQNKILCNEDIKHRDR